MTDKIHQSINKHVVVFITFLWLLPLVSFIPGAIAKYIASSLLVNILSLAIIVPLLSYILMPNTLKIIERSSNQEKFISSNSIGSR